MKYGANEAALEHDQNQPRFIRITDINEAGSLRSDSFKSLPQALAENYMLKQDDILFARSGATVGKTFIYKQSWGPACFAGYRIRFRCEQTKLIPKFLFHLTQGNGYWSQIRETTIQATIQNVSAERFGDVVLPVPPIPKQKLIIDFLDKQTAKLDALRAATERSIALLKERRAALISAAVTGQIDINTEAARV